MAALLTSETGNTEKTVKYINEARGMGISILPPDVNESDLYFTPVGEAIRFGLAAIKNVGENTAKAIRESRLAQGEFKSLYDFCERIEPRFLNKRVFESLIKSGAMDSLGPREGMLASVDDAINAMQRAARSKESGQHGLFGGGAASPSPRFISNCATPLPGAKKSASPANTPCSAFTSPAIRWKNTLAPAGFESAWRSTRSKASATAKKSPWPRSSSAYGRCARRKGARWAIFTMQDMTGVQELLAFPESVHAHGKHFEARRAAAAESSRADRRSRHASLFAGSPPSRRRRRAHRSPSEFRVRLDMRVLNRGGFDRARNSIRQAPRPNCAVVSNCVSPDGSVALLQVAAARPRPSPSWWRPSARFAASGHSEMVAYR